MFFRRLSAIAILLLLTACARQEKAKGPPARIAVLRCENLSADPSLDWMGRAISEILSADLTLPGGAPVISLAALRNAAGAMGPHPAQAPGISTEREAALATGANRLVACEFSIAGGKLRMAAVEEDAGSHKNVRQATAEGGLIAAADALAKQLNANARPFGTRSEEPMRAYADALDAQDPDIARQDFARAVAGDPNFAAAYLAWVQAEAARHDRQGVERVLALAEARGKELSDYDRARLQLDAAQVRGDASARARALAALAKTGPADVNVYRGLAETALAGRRFRDAVNYYEQALALAPDDIELLNASGYAEAYLGDYDAAIRRLREYERLRPNEPNPLDSQGDVNYYFNRYADAEKLYLAAEQKGPNFLGGAELVKAAQAHLATGDVGGADQIFNRYAAALEARHDPAAPYQTACWRYLTGRRREAVAMLEQFAAHADAAQAAGLEAQLAIWEQELGDRSLAANHAAKARAAVHGPAPLVVALAMLSTQPDAPPAEWQARAERLFGQSPQSAARDVITAYALLLGRQFAPVVPLLRHTWEESSPNSEEGLAVLLAWAMIESGKWDGITSLVGPSPIPPLSIAPLGSFYFPRLFYLRGRLAEHHGKREQAVEDYRLFLKLSGADPDIWGDRQHAREFTGVAK